MKLRTRHNILREHRTRHDREHRTRHDSELRTRHDSELRTRHDSELRTRHNIHLEHFKFQIQISATWLQTHISQRGSEGNRA